MTSFYIARQPILCASGSTYGYELLFRSSESNAYDSSVDGNAATSSVLYNAIVEIGLDNLIGNGYAFINLTGKFLKEPELLTLLPSGRCVLEILETVTVTDDIVAGVERLKELGHSIALDDFSDTKRFERLLPLADIIKYDITQHSMSDLERFRKIDEAAGRRSLVERVETYGEFEQLCGYGFDYYQGYFFAKPRILSGSKLPQNRAALIQLMAEINNPASSIEDVADIVGRDVSLGVRTLKYVNSPLNGLQATVNSIKHATVLLGREVIRNWVTLLIMSEMDDKPSELIKMALARGRFCQLVAIDQGLDGARYFTLGLLSLLDVFLNETLDVALHSITVDEGMRDELLTRTGLGGELVKYLEKFENGKVDDPIDLEVARYGRYFQEAALWSEETSGLLK